MRHDIPPGPVGPATAMSPRRRSQKVAQRRVKPHHPAYCVEDVSGPTSVPMARVEPHPLAYCVEDVAKSLGIGRTLVFQLIKERKILALKIGRRTVVTVAEMEAFLSRLKGAA